MKYTVCYMNKLISLPLEQEVALDYAALLAASNLSDYPDPTKFNIQSEQQLRERQVR